MDFDQKIKFIFIAVYILSFILEVYVAYTEKPVHGVFMHPRARASRLTRSGDI